MEGRVENTWRTLSVINWITWRKWKKLYDSIIHQFVRTITPGILIPRPRFAYSLYNFHGATMTIKGSLQVSIAIIKAFFSRFLAQNFAGSRDLWIGGRRWPHIWIPWPRLAYSLYSFHLATMTIKGSLQVSIPIVKAILMRNFRPVENWRKICLFVGKWGVNVKFCFRDPKRHIPARNHVIWRIDCENRYRGLGCRCREELKKTSPVSWCAFSHIWGWSG